MEHQVIYFARDKADPRLGIDQCSELAEKMREDGRFDTRVMQAQTNYLVFWGISLCSA